MHDVLQTGVRVLRQARAVSSARTVSRAFDQALTAARGSLSTWLVLLTLRTQPVASQRELAASVGIQGATLTHHLNGMEAAGLLTRRRDTDKRRVHVVELTDKGEAAFQRMRTAAAAFDQQLRADLDAEQIASLSQVLSRLRENETAPTGAAWHEPQTG